MPPVMSAQKARVARSAATEPLLGPLYLTIPAARDSITLIPGEPRPGAVEKRLTFRYGQTLVLGRVFVFGSFTALIALAVALFTTVPLLPVLTLATVLIAYLVLFVVSPLLTEHWITRSRLILRQGWYFRAVIPFPDIEAVYPVGDSGPLRAPLGLSRPFGQAVLFVTAGRTSLVTVRLRAPRRFWQAFGFGAREIVFDVLDRARFLDALEERRRLFPPVEAERADA